MLIKLPTSIINCFKVQNRYLSTHAHVIFPNNSLKFNKKNIKKTDGRNKSVHIFKKNFNKLFSKEKTPLAATYP